MLDRVPYLNKVLTIARTTTTWVWLGSYGAPTPKPLKLIATASWVPHLHKPKPQGLSKLSYQDDAGRVYGLRDKLAASQAYPEEFGQAVAEELDQFWLKRLTAQER